MLSSFQKSPFNGSVFYGYESETTLLPIVPMLIEANGRTWFGRIESSYPKFRGRNVLISSYDMAPQDDLDIKRDPLNERATRGLRTAFGWCIAGLISPAAIAQLQCYSLSLAPPPDQDLVHAIDRFLLTEANEARAGVKVPISDEEVPANKILNETTKLVGNGYES
ncbi:hypothetical protein OUZ56_011784 [Daphnia magna]|uniref:Uncharacterized protein n=1 Tax=Daphnia magna TaxID=35525 RepID=A0ABQ9Z1A7_9CRUS|nr:hypothetical protein OUZ56_011784 [Daphnia magna]